MYKLTSTPVEGQSALYEDLLEQARALFKGERDFIANCANLSSLIFHTLPDVNWAGFYFHRGGELVLGPFQGKPACVRIALGRGVCGKAATDRRTVIVPDVHAFPGHIACDSASNAEIVVPLIAGDRLLGVLDLDSPRPGRFDDTDRVGLEAAVGLLLVAEPAATAQQRKSSLAASMSQHILKFFAKARSHLPHSES
jgi:GAF domain-containing protein